MATTTRTGIVFIRTDTMAKETEQQTMEEYLLSQLDTPVVLKDGTMMTKPDGSPMTKQVRAPFTQGGGLRRGCGIAA